MIQRSSQGLQTFRTVHVQKIGMVLFAKKGLTTRQVKCRYSSLAALLERDEVSVADVMTLNKATNQRGEMMVWRR